MRSAPRLMALWQQGGPFIGDEGAYNQYVTVEPAYWLTTDASVATADPTCLPFRWFQRADNSQVELEVPNVRSIQTDTTLDAQAAECTLTLVNTKMDPNLSGQNVRLGDPGYLNAYRSGLTALARWGPKNQDWAGILVPNALLRTYQGWGGKGLPREQAIAEGYVIQTGTWLVDSVAPNDKGQLELRCRNMAKLAIEQDLFPPLIPNSKYPLQFCRYVYTPATSDAAPVYDSTNPIESGPGDEGPKWITEGTMDPDGDGYWLVGTDGGVFAFGYTAFYGSRGGDEAVDPAPMASITSTATGRGYWLVAENGQVFTFGDAVFYGDGQPAATPIVKIRATPSGYGYWLVDEAGGVYAFGDASTAAGAPPPGGLAIVDMRPTSTGAGYWLLGEDGTIYTYGDATYYGGAAVSANSAVGLAALPDGSGYWIVDSAGNVYPLGTATEKSPNGDWAEAKADLNDPIFGIDATPSGNGYLLWGGDGGVFSFGDAPFWGSLLEPFTYLNQGPGNYSDFADIVKLLLLWSGWLLQGTGADDVYGNIESTGTFSNECLPPDLFDKRKVIDAIIAIRDVVGYIWWVDEVGAARFESPNWWTPGNFMETGERVQFIPELDERQNLTAYQLEETDRPARSELIISSNDPMAGFSTTVTTRYTPPFASMLRGMVKPAMWVNAFFTSEQEQALMAELVAMHMYFQQRQSGADCVANPALQINDQVWAFEETTGESSIRYIRGISTFADAQTGEYTMSLRLAQLGKWPNEWAVQ